MQAMNIHQVVRRGRGQRLLVPVKALVVMAFTWGVLYPALLWSLRHVF
ncbi:MAG: hypothetical protein IV092_06270 [Burkholderiaceae bacterium]|nr:hypothetical protein [Burkholderiaceae bacterium]